jgi:hypothetical protein
MNDPPFVLPPRLEIQQWRAVILEFVEEPQRILSGEPARISCLRENPLVPLLQDQDPCFALFHRRAFPPTGKTVETELIALVEISCRRKVAAPPRASTFDG